MVDDGKDWLVECEVCGQNYDSREIEHCDAPMTTYHVEGDCTSDISIYCEVTGRLPGRIVGRKPIGGISRRVGQQCNANQMVPVLQEMKRNMVQEGCIDIRCYWQYWDEVCANPMYERHEVIVL